ncbi:MAG: Asp-tRNA(Asn)/Glu-tRNA(Gln) amidotransferase subunit GatC [Cytophagaceae bacterium]|nr:Asp-tRNA(Asn)/Glu-tRNA(Gln) amidotransferase subunit GatC [Cytophagaceae bacterium]MBK9511953.1 Asp-tRNA(Asn)/Glu-tRNA(Gln) amidotransferase subunit GatC [Cytophagaceae bacterium]MBK9934896.1 Asp-tRNA(Asn)/Glu-tRNA(Gln) amidotransferase subunit GatC [Cytophagaceae bacterium]MBL0301334.1 Asp-tRNA(Asn)/Glu-tRNA(Gln) amidotransferase subunit GatC [Cytophagaceae bacterium]MBL0324153.1 Asp-tRNA(Asn)/Glu-tRNA(Gln) amidotransferase subunit GatC [Cytophagaceae bacterium]
MKIDKEKIEQIAHLARLELTEEEKQSMAKDFENILEWMDQLKEIDTTQTEPLIHMHKGVNIYRKDEAEIHLSREEGLLNAPLKNEEYFKVPKVIE